MSGIGLSASTLSATLKAHDAVVSQNDVEARVPLAGAAAHADRSPQLVTRSMRTAITG
jgi:hypothetical protein